LAIIIGAGAREVFHIGWNGGFSGSLKNPIARIPIAHGIGDPHFGSSISEAYSSSGSYYGSLQSLSGIYNWLYASRFTTVFDIYNFVIACELLAVALIVLGNLHLIYSSQFTQWLALNLPAADALGRANKGEKLAKGRAADIKVYPIFIWPSRLFVACFDSLSLTSMQASGRIIIGLLSGAWSAHLLYLQPNEFHLEAFYTGHWSRYGSTILTFLGGLRSDTSSLHLTDIAHHHLAIALLFLWQGGVSGSIYKAFCSSSTFLQSSASLYPIVRSRKSLDLHLSLGLAIASIAASGVGNLVATLSPYPYLSMDILASSALCFHHSSIASSLMIGSFAHAGIFLVRDGGTELSLTKLAPSARRGGVSKDLIGRILSHTAPLLSHLTWVTLLLGFHTLAVYVHNDTSVAFGLGEGALMIEPVFAQIVQQFSGKALYGTRISFPWGLDRLNKSFGSLISPVLQGDLLAAHAVALGLHISVLILLKSSLDARQSKLMPQGHCRFPLCM
jgi:photosystem I P700 chlorophyll a apoprotein A2